MNLLFGRLVLLRWFNDYLSDFVVPEAFHEKIDATVDCRYYLLVKGLGRSVLNGHAVAHDEALKSHLSPELSDIFCILMHLLSVERRIADHYYLNTGIYLSLINLQEFLDLSV